MIISFKSKLDKQLKKIKNKLKLYTPNTILNSFSYLQHKIHMKLKALVNKNRNTKEIKYLFSLSQIFNCFSVVLIPFKAPQNLYFIPFLNIKIPNNSST